jgi:hypothetical protein
MPNWTDLNERQQQYLQAIYETDQEQEADERSRWKRGGPYLAHVGYSVDIHWIRLTSFGEQFYRENWQSYRELYPEMDVPAPD